MYDINYKRVGAAIVINPASTKNSGKYICTAQNEKGAVKKTVNVKVV